MEVTSWQYEKTADCFPRQQRNVKFDSLLVFNAILHAAENGCKWRGRTERFGNWHSIYTRMSRRSRNGVLDRIFKRLHMTAASAECAAMFSLSPGQAGDAPEGRRLLTEPGAVGTMRDDHGQGI